MNDEIRISVRYARDLQPQHIARVAVSGLWSVRPPAALVTERYGDIRANEPGIEERAGVLATRGRSMRPTPGGGVETIAARGGLVVIRWDNAEDSVATLERRRWAIDKSSKSQGRESCEGSRRRSVRACRLEQRG